VRFFLAAIAVTGLLTLQGEPCARVQMARTIAHRGAAS
jgi:hypothetical protein